jgi:hypothetical protein|tara:strand:- start:27 stop:566 length:540 start_codon:yes stop_codon:yes gene_type:complete
MKKLVLFLAMVLLISCSKEEEVLLPIFEISLDGVAFDPYERYAKIETFGGEKLVDNKLKKIFILYLQIDDGEPRLDKQHFSLYCLDSDANDDGELLDVGTYTWESPDGKYAGVEIPGNNEYIVWNEVIVSKVSNALIDLTAEGEFYNPYIQGTMTVSMRLENFPIGSDIDATPYGYLLN